MTTRADAARRVSLMPQNKWRNGSQRQRKAHSVWKWRDEIGHVNGIALAFAL